MISSFRGHNHFLSNFFVWRFEFQGMSCATAEHAFQASKTLDSTWRKRILMAAKAGEAKQLGRRAPLRCTRAEWDGGLRVEAMRAVLRAKFSDRALAAMLLETGDEELIEENYWHDRFWGTVEGHGENMLGKLLMEIRKEIRAGLGRKAAP